VAQSSIPTAVAKWFELVKELVPDLDIRPEDIYGMDESGFPPSNQGKQRVIGRRGAKIQHSHCRQQLADLCCIFRIIPDNGNDHLCRRLYIDMAVIF
jgi:hypothetical protein